MMGLFKKNMSENEGLRYMAAGLVPYFLGMVLFIFDIRAAIIGVVGAFFFIFGYHRWSPIKAIWEK
jgi:hypothetical protein